METRKALGSQMANRQRFASLDGNAPREVFVGEQAPLLPGIRVLKNLLEFNCYDPFRIYKMNLNKYQHRYQIYKKGRLRLANNGRTRDFKFRKLLWLMVVYYAIKSHLTALLQYLEHRGGNSWLSLAAQFIGNPMTPLGDVALFMYSITSGIECLYLVAYPYYYMKKPMDMPNLRLLLDPASEIQRLDDTITEKLQKTLSSVHFHKLNLLQEYSSRCKALSAPEDWSAVWNSFDHIFKVISNYLREPSKLRPRIYQQSYLEQFQQNNSKFMLTLWVFFQIWLVLYLALLAYQCTTGKCAELNLPDCNFSNAFTLQEKLFAAEIILHLCFTAQTYPLHLALIIMMIIFQLQLIGSIKEDLEVCLSRLKLHSSKASESDREASELLMRTLLKVTLTKHELRRGAHSMSELAAGHLLNGLAVSCFGFTTSSLQTQNSRFLRRQLYLYNFVNLNLLALLCSYVLARLGDLERLYWSVLAENSARNFESPLAPKELSSQLWRKFVYSANTSREMYAAAPFRISMTYNRVIELNFFVVSLGSFLLVR